MFESLVPDKSRPLAPTPLLLPSILLNCVIGSLLPPGQFRAISVFSMLVYQLTQAFKYDAGESTANALIFHLGVPMLLHWIDFYMLRSPEEDCWRIADKAKPPKTIWQRFMWYLSLNGSMRGIGWNWQVRNIPQAASSENTKWGFVRSRLLKAIMWYGLMDLGSSIARHSIHAHQTTSTLAQDTLPRQLFFTWLPAICAYWALQMPYCMISALAVATGLSSPQDWPPAFGRLLDVRTVRDVWAKFWHQLINRHVNVPFQALTRVVPMKRGTLISRFTQLILAFSTSAAIHFLGAMNTTHDHTYENAILYAKFFLIQTLAITFEDVVINFGKSIGMKRSPTTELSGRLWTFAWFSYCLRYFAAHHYQFGSYDQVAMPSYVEAILDRFG